MIATSVGNSPGSRDLPDVAESEDGDFDLETFIGGAAILLEAVEFESGGLVFARKLAVGAMVPLRIVLPVVVEVSDTPVVSGTRGACVISVCDDGGALSSVAGTGFVSGSDMGVGGTVSKDGCEVS